MSQAGRIANAGKVLQNSSLRIGAEGVVKKVTPIKSRTPEEARLDVLKAYKALQRITPIFWHDYDFYDIPLPLFRDSLKKQFLKNAHINDIRIIDRKVAECYNDIESINMRYYNHYHIRNILFRENIEPKSKDFLSQFLSGN